MRCTAVRQNPAQGVLRAAGFVVLGLVCGWGCGGRSDRDERPSATAGTADAAGASGGTAAGNGGAVGSGGAAASAGTSNASGGSPGGGFAGSSGSSGGSEPTGGTTSAGATAGSASDGGATSGSGGSAGAETGGMPGSSGAAGAPGSPECDEDQDCEIAKDCCVCQAVPKGASFAACRVACGDSNACDLQGISAVATCTLGRCTLAASCDALGVTCNGPPPTCPLGQAPSVTENGCWGPCLAATECSGVTDCDACGDAHCVKFSNVGGTSVRCIDRQAQCETGNLCECLSPCGDFGCGEQNGEVGCFCLGC
jgi:hypothetical protein